MESRGVPAVTKLRSTGDTSARAALRRKSGRAAFIKAFWLAASASVLAGAIGVWIAFKPAASPIENAVSASTADPHRLASIVHDDGSVRCVRGTFDNVTGSVAENKKPCETAPVLGRGEAAPQPLGTIHTLSAISNSFRK